jgi:ubiquitin C-terminal hydrolase
LNDFLDENKYRLNTEKKLDCLLLEEWNKLRRLMWSKNCVISPKGFIVSVHNIARAKDKEIFTGYTQNDLPEFLMFLIDSFHEALSRKVIINIQGVIKKEEDKIAKSCYEMMKMMYEKEYSEILKYFYGIQVTHLKDLEGNIKSEKPEPYFMLNLPIPENNKRPNIYECLDLYSLNELMDGDNKWYDEDKKEKIVVNKKTEFFSFPDVLVLDFKRFNNSLRKNQVLIEFPLEGLDLKKYVIGYNKDSYVYDLYGVCNHSGSVMGGHYTAYIKNPNGKWYLYNDVRVSEVEEKEVVSPKAYCLFYRKVK